MSKFPWLKLRKKTEPDYEVAPPIRLGNESNGEYFHQQTPNERAMRRKINQIAEDRCRHLGMDRREFMASSVGMATTLAVINQMGCAEDAKDGGTTPTEDVQIPDDPYDFIKDPTKPYVVPQDSTCGEVLDQEYFIMDVQTHAFDDGEWREKQVAYPIFARLIAPGSCPETEKLDCFSQKYYGELMFADSETTLAVITSWPAASCFPERDLLKQGASACGLPLSNDGMKELRDWINSRAMSQRVINQVQVMPNDMLERQIEGMYAAMEDEQWRCGSWKAYPAWRSDTYPDSNGYADGYFLTDPIGIAFIEAGLKLGVPNFAIHKGLPIPGFNVKNNEPTDVGPVAKRFPEANFVIYHSAFGAGTGGDVVSAIAPTQTETVPYASTGPVTGVNMLIRSLIDEGLITENPDGTVTRKEGLNVYAEMGSVWGRCLGNPVTAQHYMGKLLKYFGPDNIVWGTDCILGGSPSGQIGAFKLFTITQEFQDLYGYPAITNEMKAKIFGLNAARIYRIDAERERCRVQRSDFAMLKNQLDSELGKNRWVAKPPLGPRTRREFMALAKWNKARRLPG